VYGATHVYWSVQSKDSYRSRGLEPGQSRDGFGVTTSVVSQHSSCGFSASFDRDDGHTTGFGGGCSHQCGSIR
jgi:hypothetical protein